MKALRTLNLNFGFQKIIHGYFNIFDDCRELHNFTIRAVDDEDCEKIVENIIEKIKLNQRINPITIIFAHPFNVK